MELTLQQKIGQKLVTGFPSTSMTKEFIEAVKKYKIGNVILFKENVESEEQLLRLCNEIHSLILQETGIPAFITIDQEGGMVCRMPDTAANAPGAMAIAATGDTHNAYLAGLATAKELRYFGINFDLAPVVDVNSNPQNPIIGVRSYGDTPKQVIEYSLQMIKGLEEGGTLAAVKHFPGHGDTAVDSHLNLPTVDKSYEQLCKVELPPFIAAINANVDAVMTTHILFPQLDNSGKPATMSRPILTDLLRQKLGFKGLIISDCMEMKAIADFYGTVDGAIGAVNAGVDLVFISHDAVLASDACNALFNAAQNNKISLTELDASVERILQYKSKVNNIPQKYDRTAEKQVVLNLLQKSFCQVQAPKHPFVLGNSPICMGCPALRITLVGNVLDKGETFGAIMAPLVGGTALDYPVDPTDEEIANIINQIKGYSSVIIGSYNAHLKKGQKKLIEAVAKCGVPTAVLALRNPYDLCNIDENLWGIAVFEYTKQAIEAASEILLGTQAPVGVLPISLP